MDITALIDALARKLGVDADTDGLEDYLNEALIELCLYLNMDAEDLPEMFSVKVVDLAAIRWQRDSIGRELPGVASLSTTEERLSQNVSYRSASDWQTQEDQLLKSIARYRKVEVHGAELSET